MKKPIATSSFSFDGKGVSGADEHRTRLATLTAEGIKQGVGPLFAAAPKLQYALERILAAHDTGNNGAVMGEANLCRYFAEMARTAVAEAEGGAA